MPFQKWGCKNKIFGILNGISLPGKGFEWVCWDLKGPGTWDFFWWKRMCAEPHKMPLPNPTGGSSHSWCLIITDAQRMNPSEP